MTEALAVDEAAASELERVLDDHDDPRVAISNPMGKLNAFALQLLEEFLTQHKLEDTLTALQAELEHKGIPRPDAQLWFEMHHSCRVALAQGGSSGNSTLERLLAFCVCPKATKSLALDVLAPPVTLCLSSPQPSSISKLKQTSFSLKQAYSQLLSPVVRPSQRHKEIPSSTPTAGRRLKTDASISETKDELSTMAQSRPSSSLLAAPLGPVETKSSSCKRHKLKKKRNHGVSNSVSNNRTLSQLHAHPARTQSSMVMVYDEHKKRDLSCGRSLARELRILRAERVQCDALRRETASLEAALARHDPYANELVRERYGFIHRVECALCTFPFLPVNVPHRVSFKCIMDLHELWGYRPPQRELAARYRPPLCYDAVSVCRMCGPILFEHTTATPSTYNEQLSPTMARASSLSALPVASQLKTHSPMVNASEHSERRPFCSDPYALPPLVVDDVLDDGDSYGGEEVLYEIRGTGVGVLQEFPAKAIIYSQQQTDTVAFMSSKEWEIINPQRSNIRQVMENTIK